jgi:hypothetical protein
MGGDGHTLIASCSEIGPYPIFVYENASFRRMLLLEDPHPRTMGDSGERSMPMSEAYRTNIIAIRLRRLSLAESAEHRFDLELTKVEGNV